MSCLPQLRANCAVYALRALAAVEPVIHCGRSAFRICVHYYACNFPILSHYYHPANGLPETCLAVSAAATEILRQLVAIS